MAQKAWKYKGTYVICNFGIVNGHWARKENPISKLKLIEQKTKVRIELDSEDFSKTILLSLFISYVGIGGKYLKILYYVS